MVKLGDKKKVLLRTEGEWVRGRLKMVETYAEGEVVYVHPEKRWYTVLLQFPFGSYRESFHMIGE